MAKLPGFVVDGGALSLHLPAIRNATWISTAIPIDGAGRYTASTISWDETSPPGTSVAVFAALDESGAYQPVTRGGAVPGLFYGESLTGKTVRLAVTLTTTDATTSPTVDNLNLEVDGVSFPVLPASSINARLLAHLNTPFDRQPIQTLALRIAYDGGMTWQVKNRLLTTQVSAGSGKSLNILLPMFTLQTLADYLAAQPGYSVPYLAPGVANLSAVALTDDAGDIDRANGDHVYAYTSLLWVYMQSVGLETQLAQDDITAMLAQMDIRTAADNWLDTWGAYFVVARAQDEADANYAERVLTEPFQIRCNNLALEQLVQNQTGIQVSIVDLDWRDYNVLHTNAPPLIRQGVPSYVQVTNTADYVSGPFNSASPKKVFLASLGITLYADGTYSSGGYPYWGDPANDNPLVCAFAVILGSASFSAAAKASINAVIEANKLAGTAALFFEPERILHTNTASETTNSVFVAGPGGATYTQVTI